KELAFALPLSHPWHSTFGENQQWRIAGLIQPHTVIEPIGSGPDVSIGRSRVPLEGSTEDNNGVRGRTGFDGNCRVFTLAARQCPICDQWRACEIEEGDGDRG